MHSNKLDSLHRTDAPSCIYSHWPSCLDCLLTCWFHKLNYLNTSYCKPLKWEAPLIRNSFLLIVVNSLRGINFFFNQLNNLQWVLFILILEDISPFCGATETPVLDFWWCILWFQSKSGRHYLHLAEAYVLYVPRDSPMVWYLPTSW